MSYGMRGSRVPSPGAVTAIRGGKRIARLALVSRQNGQILPWVGLMMIPILGLAGLAIDVGRGLLIRQQLQSSSAAAALAGAHTLPDPSYVTVAQSYGSGPGGANPLSGASDVQVTVTGECLTTVTNWGIACLAPTGYNALVVTETATIPTYFARVLGVNNLNISATSTAAMRGSPRAPYNVAIVLDTTASMQDPDTVGNCTSTRVACAIAGIRTLMLDMSPCPSNLTTCGAATNGNVANAVDEISIFTYPGLNAGDAQIDYTQGNPIQSSDITKYMDATGSTYLTVPYYQILPLGSDYRVSDTTKQTDSDDGLNPNSNLALAAGAVSGTGMQALGGVRTYYAGALEMAQQYLAANSTGSRSNAQNVIILLSDGDANAPAADLPNASTTSGVYPSSVNECQQAVARASAAKSAGTMIFTVAYGSNGSPSSSCSTDNGAISACDTLRQMASSSSTFFVDQSSANGGCTNPDRPTTDLNTIFGQIAGFLSEPRLIQNGTT